MLDPLIVVGGGALTLIGIKIAVATPMSSAERPLPLVLCDEVFENVCDSPPGSSNGCGPSSSNEGSISHGGMGIISSGFVNVGLGGLLAMIIELTDTPESLLP